MPTYVDVVSDASSSPVNGVNLDSALDTDLDAAVTAASRPAAKPLNLIVSRAP